MSADRYSRKPSNGQHPPAHRSAEDVAASQATEDVSAPHETDDLEPGAVAEPGVLKLLVKQLHELEEYASYYVAAKTDSARLSLRNAVLRMSFAVLGFVVIAGLIITGAWFVLEGTAEGVSALFGGRLWVGNIVTGALLLVGMGLALYCAVAIRRTASRKRVVRKYEQRQARQRARFGRSAAEPTAVTPSPKQ